MKFIIFLKSPLTQLLKYIFFIHELIQDIYVEFHRHLYASKVHFVESEMHERHERNYYASKNTIQWFSWKFNDIHLSFICAPSAHALLFGHFCNGEMLGSRFVFCAFLWCCSITHVWISWVVFTDKMQFEGLFLSSDTSIFSSSLSLPHI